MLSDLLQLSAGALLLYLGATWFVGGASAVATALRIPQLVVGLTVVAYGTSAPEVVVGIEAAAGGHGEVALGNVIGSNVANIGLILGVAALVRPARVDGALRRRELPVLLLSTALVPLSLSDGVVRAWEGAALLVLALTYTAWMIRTARAPSEVAAARADARAAREAAGAAGAPTAPRTGRALAITAIGLVVLLVGGSQFIAGAVKVAAALGMSEQLVGITIVAVGTSLPELVTSILAARRGHSDLAVGNVIGSNIFNALLCLGAAALAGELRAALDTLALNLAALAVMTVVGALFVRTERTISRLEGAFACALYAAFMLLTVLRG